MKYNLVDGANISEAADASICNLHCAVEGRKLLLNYDCYAIYCTASGLRISQSKNTFRQSR